MQGLSKNTLGINCTLLPYNKANTVPESWKNVLPLATVIKMVHTIEQRVFIAKIFNRLLVFSLDLSCFRDLV
jgi:hypothetical protein